MTLRRRNQPGPLEPGEDAVEAELDQVELVNSSGFNNTWAILGPASLLLIPVAAVLTAIQRKLKGR